MEPMNDLERELARSTQIDPSPDFAARVRTRIASEPAPSRWHVPQLALATAGAVMIGLLVANAVSRFSMPQSPAVLEHRALAVVAPLPAAPASVAAPRQQPLSHIAARMADVEVSRSEMLALQQLFSGALVAPQPGAAPDEVSIPEVAIEAINLPTLPEGDRQ
jgi:hypothetical protein